MDFCLLLKLFLDSANKSTTDLIKTASKRAIQKTAEGIGDLIDNKIADKITSVPKECSQNNVDKAKSEIELPKETYISPDNY